MHKTDKLQKKNTWICFSVCCKALNVWNYIVWTLGSTCIIDKNCCLCGRPRLDCSLVAWGLQLNSKVLHIFKCAVIGNLNSYTGYCIGLRRQGQSKFSTHKVRAVCIRKYLAGTLQWQSMWRDYKFISGSFFSPNAVSSTVRSVTLKLLAVSRCFVTQAQVDGSFGESVQKEKIVFCILSVT